MSSRCSLGVISGRWDLWPIHLDMQRGAGDILVLPSGRTSLLALEEPRLSKAELPQNRIRWDQRHEKYFWWTAFPKACVASPSYWMPIQPARNISFLLTYLLKFKSQFHSLYFLLADRPIRPCDVYQLIILCLFNEILHTPAAIWLSSGQTYALLSHHAVLRMSSGDVEHI